MPVHRLPGGKRQAVFALTDELDAWLGRQKDGAPAAELGQEAIAEAAHEPSLAPVGMPRTQRALVVGAVVVGLLGVVLGGIYSLRNSSPATEPAPREVRFEGNGFSLRYLRSDFVPGFTPYLGQAADLNQDGAQDVVLSSSPNDVIAVLLGNGDGTFQPPRIFEQCPQSDRVRIADLNRDGHLDIVVTCTLGNKVVVLWGAGDGTFPRRAEIPIPGGPRFLATGDLNGDGWPDLAVGAFGQSDLVIVKNDEGQFTPSRVAHYEALTAVAMLDWDLDGRLDVVAGLQSGGMHKVGVWRGKGDGTLHPPVLYQWPELNSLPSDLTAVDLSRDGRVDLVLSTWAGNLLLLHGLDKGGFAPPQVLARAQGVWSPAAADFDRDGSLDLLVANRQRGTLLLLRNNANGTFSPSSEVSFGNPISADFNRDGFPDIFLSASLEKKVIVLLAQPDKAPGK